MIIKYMGTVAGTGNLCPICNLGATHGHHAQRATKIRTHPEANTTTLLSQITPVIKADPVQVFQIPTQQQQPLF